MTLTTPLGLLALLALPAIVALHLFRNRLRERAVSALFLFPEASVRSDGGRTRSRLLPTASLWLELLAALVLVAWLSGLAFDGLRPRHLVVVVDQSASMSAAGTGQRAAAACRELLAGISARDQVTVVASGEVAQVVVGPQGDRDAFAAWLPGWRPTSRWHALQSAIDSARELAGQHGEIVVVTDGAIADPGSDLRVVACGGAAGNAAITSVRRSDGESLDRLLVTVSGYGAVAAGELVVHAGERELMRVPLSIPPDDDLRLAVPIDKDEQVLRITLPDDALAIDNEAFHVPEPERVVAVCDRLAPTRRERLLLPGVFDVLPGWRAVDHPEQAQLVIAAAPVALSRDQVQVVLPRPDGERRGFRSPFVVDRSHPLLAGVQLQGVGWQSGGRALPGHVLVAHGNDVLVSEELLAGGSRVWIDVDPDAGNLVRAPDWPILFANLLDRARPLVAGVRSTRLQVAEQLVFTGDDASSATLVDPRGERVARGAGDRLAHDVDRVGIWQVTAGAAVLARVAVGFVDARESDLRDRRQFVTEPAASVRDALAGQADPGPLRRWLAVLLVGLVLADWWVLQRRGA